MRYGLIGEKLSHSFSKEIHEALSSYKYELCEIPKGELASFFQKREFCAINVTMPYKKEVIPYLDGISESAKKLQAVNTVVNKGGKLFGYNTDYLGMRDMIERSKTALTDKKALVLGTGATSRTSALVCRDLGASEVYLVSREKKDGAISYGEATSLHSDASIIINATPVGMYPEPYSSPISLDSFGKLEAVFDAVYNPLRTSLTLEASDKGIYAESGLYMLISQAVHASQLFLDMEYEDNQTEDVYRKILKSKENIVLIGMPSCGKTTVGKILAESLDREFFDLDDEIENYLGCTIAEYFEDHTEPVFRQIETEITKNISKKNGVIIATGGGCVLKSENIKALRSNGRLYFLDRAPSRLIPTHSRPLARKSEDIENLYRLRYQIYQNVCDAQIDGNLSPNEAAKRIREEFTK